MMGFNLSALAVRERAITLFLIVSVILAGGYAFLKLGRAEDPSFTIKVLTVSAVWPGATAQEMQDLVAEPLEKRMQELRWYDRVETFTRPGLVLMTVSLRDDTPAREVPDEFYQARKKLGDEARNLPQGALGPFVNDEYSDVTFALYAVEAPGMPPRLLTREAEKLRQRLLHVAGVKKVDILGERPGTHLRRVLLCPAGDARRRRPRHLRSAPAPERGHSGRIDRHQRTAGPRPSRRRL